MTNHIASSRRHAHTGFAALLLACAPAWAQVAPDLGTSAPFAVLGTTSVTCTDTGPGIGINGNVGTGGAIVNSCLINGTVVAPVLPQVLVDFNAAYAAIDAQNPVCNALPIPIVTTTLPPGVYCSAADTTIGAGVILTLQGNATDVWIFRVGTSGLGALTLTGGQVVMGGTADACNVYWKTAEGMTVTDSPSFVGSVLAGTAAVGTRTNWLGRAMARTAVTLTDPVPMTGCTAAAVASSNARQVPTLSEWAMIMLAGLLAMAGFAALRRQR